MRAGIVCLGLAAAGQATTVQIQNIEAFVHFEASATPQDTLSIGSPTFTSQLDAGSLGNFLFTWQNMPGSEIADLTFTVFFDADIAGADNTYFNEYGEFISLAFPVLARVDAITPAGWEIDEPEYVHGRRGGDAWRRAAAAWKALYDEKPDSLDRKRELARSYLFLAGALSRAVKREEARETALLANLSAQLKRYADAVPLFQEQIRLREKLSAKDPNNLNAIMGIAGTMDRIGLTYLRLKRPAEGMSYLKRSLEQQHAVLAKDPDNVLVDREMLYVLTDLTEAHQALKRRNRMCRYATEATVILKGPIARTGETPTDAAKKEYVKNVLAACASSAGD